ncbi:DNA-binding transcriptional LysR family regulator [Natronocella acetinitrilica]|uniref:DNA-binding transcriptional LysR family regulator n=1 Tax=Natronocella acetinitrilica TaxID=414046 RepID=A0AAE3G2T4_9GAMM|nr:LysR family transcriptional regulator [Natronocella acetinitrilica]MCP1673393.1 DNA-binding transcriptional LysR family regulator [Natronocella acetinitrilica]
MNIQTLDRRAGQRRSEQMDSTALAYFQVAAESGSIRGASQVLHVSASAISRQITRLESQLGVPLFERLAHGLALTSAGELLLFHVRRTTRELQSAQREIRDLAGQQSGHVRIVIVESAARALLVPAMDSFWRDHPHVKVSLHVAGNSQVLEMIEQGEADIGVAFNVPAQSEQYVYETAHLNLGAVMAANHPLASADRLRIRDLVDYPIFLPDRSLMLHKAVSEVDGEWPLKVHLVTNSIAAMSLLASCSLGVALKTRLGLSDEMESGKLAFVRLHDRRLSVQRLTLLVQHRLPFPVLATRIGQALRSVNEA